MLTGYDPTLTGVLSNGKFNPIPSGYSIFERLHQAFGKQGITTIMLTGKDHNLGSQPARPAQPRRALLPGSSGHHGVGWRPDAASSVVGERAVNYIRSYASKGRFFLFIHFADIDFCGHRYGEGSEAYDRAW
jgi:predicted AlkP superfamily pyrophosphatase or phosphodiesterase